MLLWFGHDDNPTFCVLLHYCNIVVFWHFLSSYFVHVDVGHNSSVLSPRRVISCTRKNCVLSELCIILLNCVLSTVESLTLTFCCRRLNSFFSCLFLIAANLLRMRTTWWITELNNTKPSNDFKEITIDLVFFGIFRIW